MEGLIRDMKAKGLINIKTFIIIYLKAYDIAKFKKPTETKLFNKPFNVKILKEESSK